jgi:hypothetical protein
MPGIPALGRMRWEDHKLKSSLDNKASSKVRTHNEIRSQKIKIKINQLN